MSVRRCAAARLAPVGMLGLLVPIVVLLGLAIPDHPSESTALEVVEHASFGGLASETASDELASGGPGLTAVDTAVQASQLTTPRPPLEPALPIARYRVQPGDSLATIAQLFDLDVPTLLGSNEIDDPDLLPLGFELAILPVKGVLYPVADGDTLVGLAERYGVAPDEIAHANALDDPSLIRIGQELILPGARPRNARSEPRPGPVVEVAARSGFIWPAGGTITSYFGEVGWTSPRGHAGLDIAAPWGTPVAAAAAGRVVLATRAGGPYGIMVIVDHGDGLRTVYAHFSELHVQAGEQVERGERLGLVGNTGFSTGPHLHFEVRLDGELRNPLAYLP